MKHVISVLLILVLFNRCAIQYASQKPEMVDAVSGVRIAVMDTLIAVNGKPVLKQERYSSTSLATLSGSDRGRAALVAVLDSLQSLEEKKQADSCASEGETAVSIETVGYTKFLTIHNVLTACNAAQYKTVYVSIRQKPEIIPFVLDRPDSTSTCGNSACIITEKSISVVSENDTVFKIPYREELLFKSEYASKGISVPFDPKSESMVVDPKTGKVLYFEDLQDIMLYISGDSLNTSVFQEVTKNLKAFRKKNKECFKSSPLLVIASYNLPMMKIFKLVLAAREVGFSLIQVAILGNDRRVYY